MSDLEIQLCENENGDLCQNVLIIPQESSVNDILAAFERFCAEKTASCYGCVGCCQERVPVTSLDAERLLQLLPTEERTLAKLCEKLLDIETFPDGAVDIRLKRDSEGCCILMDKENSCCSKHIYRTFACASHYCLPRSEKLDDIRSAIVNQGMDELVRQLYAEGILPQINIEDYPPNIFTGKSTYNDILLYELIDI